MRTWHDLRRVPDSRGRFAALALDFDGVLFDSVPECMRLSYAVFLSMEAGRSMGPSVVISEEPAPAEQARFLERRGLVRPAGHYYLLWKWLREFPDRALSPSAFERLEGDYPQAVRTFSTRFFAWRTALREQHPQTWLAWNLPFPGVVSEWPRLRSMPRYIVTTKDHASVTHLLDAYGLDTTGLFAKGDYVLKTEALRSIARAVGSRPEDVLFVDDNASHLTDGLAAGATVRWASWGYDAGGAAVAPGLRDFAELVTVALRG